MSAGVAKWKSSVWEKVGPRGELMQVIRWQGVPAKFYWTAKYIPIDSTGLRVLRENPMGWEPTMARAKRAAEAALEELRHG